MKELSKRWKILIIVVAVVCIVVVALVITAAAVTKSPTATVGRPIDPSIANDFKGDNVIIVGAGSAGLFAAYTLAYLGVDFEILEASSVFGGRVQELPAGDFADVPLDLGAEWIHVDPRILRDLLLFDDTVDVRTIVYQPQTISTYPRNRRKRNNWVRFFYKEHKFYNTTWYSYLKDYVYPFISDRLVLDTIVSSIDYINSSQVTVQTNDGRAFSGSHVIVATPVTVLQDEDIDFNPPLPSAKLGALNKVYMTAGLKVWLEFNKRFYPDMLIISGLTSFDDAALYFDAVFRKPSDRNILALFHVGGKMAYERVELDDDDLIKMALVELDSIFNGKASAHYIKGFVENWSAQPYIKGAYSYNTYDTKELLKPLDGRIYFCGEYLNEADQATVHGAAISGRNAVKRLILENS